MLDATKIKEELPYLENYGKKKKKKKKKKKTYFNESKILKEILILYDITEPRKAFTWILASIEDDIKAVLKTMSI
jgi:hypothetical protein